MSVLAVIKSACSITAFASWLRGKYVWLDSVALSALLSKMIISNQREDSSYKNKESKKK